MYKSEGTCALVSTEYDTPSVLMYTNDIDSLKKFEHAPIMWECEVVK